MSAPPETLSSRRKTAFLLGLVTFLSFIYFYEGGGWNQNSRFDLLRAIVERHTLQIDAYHENTQDKAHFNGHYYSDKAPGLVFLAVPFAVAARAALRVSGIDPESARGEIAVSYLVSAGAVALPAALAGVCLFFFGARFGGGSSGGAFAALVMCLGTPMWAYAGLFWAHALVGACLVFAFAAALKVRDSVECARRFFLGFGGGAVGGMGDGYGISGCAGVGDAGVSGSVARVAAWGKGALAGFRRSGSGCGNLFDCLAELSVCGVWIVSSELFVLRSAIVCVYAAARLYGTDLSTSGPAAETFVWVFAWAVPGVAGSAGRSGGIVVVVEREDLFGGGVGRGGDRDLLFSVQCIVLLVEGGAVVRSALRGRVHSVAVRWSGRRLGTHDAGVAVGAGDGGTVQRVRGIDGGFDEFAIVDAG